ncbi:MAG: 4-hydroxyphenylacetate decarboxylase small subunit [Elusimicrobiales bacterium]
MDTHRNCGYYAPVDVTKGICHKTKQEVAADAQSCPQFSPAPRCGNCKLYAPGKDPLTGECKASANGFFAYAGMSARECKYRRD